eukprot:15142394-Alexandrium_andersonii.AAC.1
MVSLDEGPVRVEQGTAMVRSSRTTTCASSAALPSPSAHPGCTAPTALPRPSGPYAPGRRRARG